MSDAPGGHHARVEVYPAVANAAAKAAATVWCVRTMATIQEGWSERSGAPQTAEEECQSRRTALLVLLQQHANHSCRCHNWE